MKHDANCIYALVGDKNNGVCNQCSMGVAGPQINTVQADVAAMDKTVKQIELDTANLDAGLRSAYRALIPLLENMAYLTTNAMGCGFVGSIYDSMYYSLCGTSLTAAVWMSIFFFIVGGLSLPMLICNVLLLLRNENNPEPHHSAAIQPLPRDKTNQLAYDVPQVPQDVKFVA